MSLHEYKTSQKIEMESYPFYALIMAAMRQADSNNIVLLRSAFPEIWEELSLRCNAPGGRLDEVTEANFDRMAGLFMYSIDNPPRNSSGSEE